ncbi:unnamed protein product [Musa acuminata subsp. malaccensis]|uniref:(wild Malaysian banana) hypothetical protein n=1 Tax=Musa acuminata subsp. malaccensis TaxID=214687 RepID=A0A804KQ27_MUSAM|nr:unnamed protein product [Musa acuminata subsp. malaccensis]
MHMRQEHPPLCGGDHMAFRSAYFPVKDVIDGDLCEQLLLNNNQSFFQQAKCFVTSW